MAWRSSGSSHEQLVDNLFTNNVIKSTEVADVMKRVDRSKYSPSSPYADSPQPIGYGQTISAPHMHAAALEHLKNHLKPGMRALDVGSGTGYLTVCMALMVDVLNAGGVVVGIDCVDALVKKSIENVKSDCPSLVESSNFSLLTQDGWAGYPAKGPYDAIHVGAAAASIPEALTNQLANGGKMIIPVGPAGGLQDFVEVTKSDTGEVTKRSLFGVSYVPLIRNPL